ncbi:jg10487 [Pararge aegeria aegeria]|uniref:Jg10487 protein n=1 Tax=Pararge aegeria aegeria TaxID=348720 RepID=A0A8S4REC7_9NEOP|nr:jg10487 [Pararge aegeria aegeria]
MDTTASRGGTVFVLAKTPRCSNKSPGGWATVRLSHTTATQLAVPAVAAVACIGFLTRSTERPIRGGVPQLSRLSPVCYGRYTDDIPVAVSAMLALYADDAAYITTSLTGPHAAIKMQRALDALPTWLKDWRLKVNVAKTQAVSIGRSAWTPAPLLVSLLRETVDWSPMAKYLGVTIDRGVSMRTHVRNVVAQSRTTRYLLRPMLASHLPLRAKLLIYKMYVRTRPHVSGLSVVRAGQRDGPQVAASATIYSAPHHLLSTTLRTEPAHAKLSIPNRKTVDVTYREVPE